MGRLDCVVRGKQRVSDPVRVEEAIRREGVLTLELKAGDALFFHGNMLHSSDGNPSDQRRMAFAAHFTSGSNPMFAPERNGDLGLYAAPMAPQPHAALKALGVRLDSHEVLDVKDPVRGVELTAKQPGDQAGNKLE